MTDNTDNERRPKYGCRYLEDPKKIYQYNVWDNIQWDKEQEEAARQKVEKQAEQKIAGVAKDLMINGTQRHWDKFYQHHQNRFFKDRHWLFTEFPDLAGHNQNAETPIRVFPTAETSPAVNQSSSNITSKYVGSEALLSADSAMTSVGGASSGDKQRRRNYLEIGCGVGNTVFPILQYNIDHNLFVYCCDFSQIAVDILKSHEEYNLNRCHAFVCDVTADDWKAPFTNCSLDITTLIFVLSAIHPQKMQHVVSQVYKYLKPGGLVLFRDYGRYDMAQLRFKGGQMVEDNFYIRKDGTFVYFFTQEKVREIFCGAGFVEELSHMDRRLQVNRSRQLKMYRVWVQSKFRKPLSL